MARFQFLPQATQGNLPDCQMWDAVDSGMSASLGTLATRESLPLLVAGHRRYRLKIVQATGAGPTAVTIRDLPFNPVVANSWQNVVAFAAMATGVRSVFNFGAGTGVMECFMGPFLGLSLTNNGPDSATYEIEMWTQG